MLLSAYSPIWFVCESDYHGSFVSLTGIFHVMQHFRVSYFVVGLFWFTFVWLVQTNVLGRLVLNSLMIMNVKIEPSWANVLADEFNKPYFEILTSYVRREYQSVTCYPPASLIFNAFNLCPFDAVKVVIIGQDPYHEPGQAHGLCFSVAGGVALPPSLQNIYKELQSDLGIQTPPTGDLTHWATQGVLMLNATLTVRAGQAGSHQGKGWEEFTDRVISELSARKSGLVFILWGNYAKNKGRVIDRKKHCVIESSHPSPLSANRGGFFGTKPFSRANAYLVSQGQQPINW